MPVNAKKVKQGALVPLDSEVAASLGKAFNAALLLTGTANSAEQAVLAAISSLAPETLTGEALLHTTIAMSIEQSECSEHKLGDFEIDRAAMPIELRNVLQMELGLRQCFVLRVLLGLSVESCACLLRLNVVEVAHNVCMGMLFLAEKAEHLPSCEDASYESYPIPLSSESLGSI